MNTLKNRELRPVWLKFVAVGVAALTLTGCSKGQYSPKESFAPCDVKEFSGHKPVTLHHAQVDRRDVEAIKQAVIVSPEILLEAARSLHPSGIDGSNMLDRTLDVAHDSTQGVLGGVDGWADSIDNPGDILCQVTSLGSSGNAGREVYYDQDGLNLLKKVEAELAREYPAVR